MQELLNQYTDTPEDPKLNFLLGLEYYKQNHYGPAVSFFLRCCDRAKGDLRYEALLYVHFCYRNLGRRNNTLNSILKHTIAIFPNRPEAYLHLCNLCKMDNAYMDGFMYSCLAIEQTDGDSKLLSDNLEYTGIWDLWLMKAYFSWWVDKPELCRQTYQYILKNFIHQMPAHKVDFVKGELLRLGMAPEPQTIKTYTPQTNYLWPYFFNGISRIEQNYSQILQDMFVLHCHNGKKFGTYLEIGSAFPFYTNNTALLETRFEWRGLAMDYNKDFVEQYKRERKNPVIHADALVADYGALLDEYLPGVTDIDYLQLDIQTPEETYTALTKLPFDTHRFAVITYEHDDYVDVEQKYKEKSREFLLSKGYVLAVPDVAPLDGFSFEDWYVHPELIDMNRVWILKNRLFNFDWAGLSMADVTTITREIVDEKVYEYWHKVKEGDVVVDIGSNVGAFAAFATAKKLKHLYCVEPSEHLIETSKKNLQPWNYMKNDITFVNKAIANKETRVNVFGENTGFDSISFLDFVEDYNIPYIDFLKIDAEGGEYDIFTDENIYYLTHNVGFIAAEFHTYYPGNRDQFKNFRDKYLKYFPNHKIRSCTTQTIKPGQMIDLEDFLMRDSFVDSYPCQFMVYIYNDRM